MLIANSLFLLALQAGIHAEFYLMLEIALHDHLLVDDLDRNVLAVGAVHCELDLGKGAFPNDPAELVLPYVISRAHFHLNARN